MATCIKKSARVGGENTGLQRSYHKELPQLSRCDPGVLWRERAPRPAEPVEFSALLSKQMGGTWKSCGGLGFTLEQLFKIQPTAGCVNQFFGQVRRRATMAGGDLPKVIPVCAGNCRNLRRFVFAVNLDE